MFCVYRCNNDVIEEPKFNLESWKSIVCRCVNIIFIILPYKVRNTMGGGVQRMTYEASCIWIMQQCQYEYIYFETEIRNRK